MLAQIGYELGQQRGAAVQEAPRCPAHNIMGRVSVLVCLETNFGNLFLHHIARMLDTAIAHFGDMDQTLDAILNLGKGPKGG